MKLKKQNQNISSKKRKSPEERSKNLVYFLQLQESLLSLVIPSSYTSSSSLCFHSKNTHISFVSTPLTRFIFEPRHFFVIPCWSWSPQTGPHEKVQDEFSSCYSNKENPLLNILCQVPVGDNQVRNFMLKDTSSDTFRGLLFILL